VLSLPTVLAWSEREAWHKWPICERASGVEEAMQHNGLAICSGWAKPDNLSNRNETK